MGLTLPAVLAARAMVGLGEGVALPSMNNLVAVNVPPARRATALGTAFSGFHSGNLFPIQPISGLHAASQPQSWHSLPNRRACDHLIECMSIMKSGCCS